MAICLYNIYVYIYMIRGYTAPEYAIRGHLSEKVDIYSFGIVMLEIISGRRSTDVTPDSTYEYLLKEVNTQINIINVESIILRAWS